jgi:hypothetical protein
MRPIGRLGACCVLLVLAQNAAADGVIAYRNETPFAVVIQSSAVIDGVGKTGKPQTLLPGERGVDSLIARGNRRVVIYDARRANTVLLQANLNVQENAFYRIVQRPDTAGRPKLPQAPVLDLVKSFPSAVLPQSGEPPPPKKR